jgi:hypothetical protein
LTVGIDQKNNPKPTKEIIQHKEPIILKLINRPKGIAPIPETNGENVLIMGIKRAKITVFPPCLAKYASVSCK